MKKFLGFLIVIALVSFVGSEIKYKADFSETDIKTIAIHLSRVARYLDNSSLPHNEVRYCQGQIDSAWALLNSKLVVDSSKKK